MNRVFRDGPEPDQTTIHQSVKPESTVLSLHSAIDVLGHYRRSCEPRIRRMVAAADCSLVKPNPTFCRSSSALEAPHS